MITRAVVLGGGGIAGIAWESGVIAGLADNGIKLNMADKVIGTSAGSIVGAALTNGQNMKDYLAAMLSQSAEQDQLLAGIDFFELFGRAAAGDSAEEIGRNFGRITQSRVPAIADEERTNRMKQLVGQFSWSDALTTTALNVETGQTHQFDKDSGVELWQAVAASSAVPGIWGAVHLNGEEWIDGGLTSGNNVPFAEGYDQVVVIAMIEQGQGTLPNVYDEVEKLRENSHVTLITPDDTSRPLVADSFNVSLAEQIGAAGYAQGVRFAQEHEDLRKYWSS
ncbi:patatin-like phospholipase family protein [Macrococcus brunensis]|uniref:patatin-like phospholipase family protein n=1 Tax=Macrococcus brunensis TaxID=198483 RepID=UPI001EEFA6CF|nr:patatin-like phospholipase family protein [Macrococcus brunensis]ULG71279.1 patatin-like phospholipase family protein [Macrococcus brunensis]ULG73586.1 patatin-like phospholipase family protein [Macrococcus brunensis]